VKRIIAAAGLLAVSASPTFAAPVCTPTGFVRDSINMTAAYINPVGTVAGDVNAAGCNIAIYYDSTGSGGTVKNANVHGANYFGILVNGDAGSVSVDVLNSAIHDIGESPLNGSQHGVAIYYRGFSDTSAVTARISGNILTNYQKGGIVANGQAVQASISENIVTGQGHVTYIAQNGIQVGYGASASVMRNTVTDNSFIGFPGDGSPSGGILVVGGGCYGGPYTTGTQIVQNVLRNNDVGAYLSNIDDNCVDAPAAQTNIKVVNNTISNDQCFNAAYVAAISDIGNNDKMITNRITGYSCPTVFNPAGNAIDADTSFTNRPKVHANK
jgi:hypothetical protein